MAIVGGETSWSRARETAVAEAGWASGTGGGGLGFTTACSGDGDHLDGGVGAGLRWAARGGEGVGEES
jgi:hypothetical protein